MYMYTTHTGNLNSDMHSTVFIADTGKAVFVWIGSGASKDERKQAMGYAHVRTKC